MIILNRDNNSLDESLKDGEVYFNKDNKHFYMWYKGSSYQIPDEVQELKNLITNFSQSNRKTTLS